MKQETLEEVAPMVELVVFLDRIKKNLTNKTEVLTIQLIIDTIKSEFVDKELKWQAERMYSEEVINEMFDTLKRNAVNNVATITNIDLFISSWKRELKNK